MKDKPEYGGGWTSTPDFTEADQAKLSVILSLEISSPKLVEFSRVLLRAGKLQDMLSRHEDREATLSEVKASLKKLSNGLRRAEEALDEMNGKDEQILDQYYYLANNRDLSLMDMPGSSPSGFLRVIHRMRNSVNYYEGQLQSPGKGKRSDKTYTTALIDIASAFSTSFPEIPLSHNKRTVFFNVIVFWFDLIGKPIVDPSRHIETMLIVLDRSRP